MKKSDKPATSNKDLALMLVKLFRFFLLLRPMKSFVKRITTKSVAILMIGIIGLLIANKGLYIHSHKLENGSFVTHSHPYDKKQDSEPYKNHHHSKAEFILYSSLDLLIIPFSLIILFLLFKGTEFLFTKPGSIYDWLLSFSQQGRAPPIS